MLCTYELLEEETGQIIYVYKSKNEKRKKTPEAVERTSKGEIPELFGRR